MIVIGPLVVGSMTSGQEYNVTIEVKVVDKPGRGLPDANYDFVTPTGQSKAK
jgi:hypothetical protein